METVELVDLNKISYSGGYGDASTEKFVTLSSENDNQFDLLHYLKLH